MPKNEDFVVTSKYDLMFQQMPLKDPANNERLTSVIRLT
jgi:hypothetical protein